MRSKTVRKKKIYKRVSEKKKLKSVKKDRKDSKKKSPAKNKYVTLREAAEHCRVGHNTFRNYIDRYPDMPIHRRGVGRDGYQIDLKELDKWREENNLLNFKPRILSARTGEGKQGDLPGLSDERRKQKLEADLLQLKYDREMEKVVDRDEIIKFLSTRISQLAKRLDAMPTIIGKKAGLAPEVVEKIRRYADDCRFAMITDDNGYFSAPAEEINAEI
jgi:hypothetical protein